MSVTTPDRSSVLILRAIHSHLEANRKKLRGCGHKFAGLHRDLVTLEKQYKEYLRSETSFLERTKEMFLHSKTSTNEDAAKGSEDRGTYSFAPVL